MNGLLNKSLVLIVLIIVSVWGVAEIITLQNLSLQLALLTACFIGVLLVVAAPKVSFNVKFISLVVFGYCVAGKGFAYISPVKPFYIGEIALLLGFLGLVVNTVFKNNRVQFTNLQRYMLLLLFLSALRLYIDFKSYGLMAVRDSSVAYYMMFAFISAYYFLNEKNRDFFEKFMIVACYLGCFVLFDSTLINVMGKLVSAAPWLPYEPHNDILVPVSVALFFYLCAKNFEKFNIFRICLMLVLLLVMFLNKTAYVYSFALTYLFFMLLSKDRRYVTYAGAVGFVAVLGVSISLVLKDNLKNGSQQNGGGVVADLGIITEDTNYEKSTTHWRVEWWRIIAEKTMENSPMLGSGYGSDITSDFVQSYYNVTLSKYDIRLTSRYPHNIFFTVLGRLGLVGVAFFLVYFIASIVVVKKYMSRCVRLKKFTAVDALLVSFLIAGMANSFVQSTYEAPYAAIPHWVCFGAILAKRKTLGRELSSIPAEKTTEDPSLIESREVRSV